MEPDHAFEDQLGLGSDFLTFTNPCLQRTQQLSEEEGVAKDPWNCEGTRRKSEIS